MTEDPGIHDHYLRAELTAGQAVITMNKREFGSEKQVWTKPDSVAISANVPALERH